MFTNGEKYRVLNSPDVLAVTNAAGTVTRATSAAIVATDVLDIKGFGKFPIDNITEMKMRRAADAVAEDKSFTVVAPAGVAIGNTILVTVALDTTRYQVDIVSADRIGGATSISFATAPLTAITADDIRTAIVTAWTNHAALFSIGDNIINVVAGIDPDEIRITADSAGSISIPSVKITLNNGTPSMAVPIRLALSATNSSAFEGDGLGKFLSESVQLLMGNNLNPYGLDTADSMVDLRGKYTSISFTHTSTVDEHLSHVAADYGMTGTGVPKSTRFQLWFNEATCLAANSAINDLAAIAVLRAAAVADMTATVIGAPLTTAQELTETLIIADQSSVATAAAFIA